MICNRCNSENVSPWIVEDVANGKALYSCLCRDCEQVMYIEGIPNSGPKRNFYKDRDNITQLDRALLAQCGIKY